MLIKGGGVKNSEFGAKTMKIGLKVVAKNGRGAKKVKFGAKTIKIGLKIVSEKKIKIEASEEHSK